MTKELVSEDPSRAAGDVEELRLIVSSIVYLERYSRGLASVVGVDEGSIQQ